MRVSKNSYYTWFRVKDTKKQKKTLVYLKERIKRLFFLNREVYGSFRIQKALEKERLYYSRSYIAILMRELGLNYSKQIIDWMNKDNYSQTRTYPEYNINSNNIATWKPTPPSYIDAIEPHWNKIRPFVLDSTSQFKPKKHPKFTLNKNGLFYKELQEVYNIKKKIEEKGDNSDEIAIARFWDCNPYVSINKGHFMFAEKKLLLVLIGLEFVKLLVNKRILILIKL